MTLDQFDKLHILVKELEEKTRMLKQGNYTLNLENKKLEDKISILGSNSNGRGTIEINNLKKENESLVIKNEEARTQLSHLITQVERNIVLEKGIGLNIGSIDGPQTI